MRSVSLIILAISAAAVAVPANAQLPTRKYLPTGIAIDAASAAVLACSEKGEYIAAAVADESGNALAIVRDDRARGQSVDTARNWARQGALQVPPPSTQRIPRPPALTSPNATESQRQASEEAMRRAEEMRRRQHAQQQRQFGHPILVDGLLIGVIAAAGAHDPQTDIDCAAAGVAKIRDKLK